MGTPLTTSSAARDDAELFARFIEGDDAAFERLLERHNRRLYAYCLKMLGETEAARDVMQGLWERVIRMRESRSTLSNPLGMFVTILRNLSLNYKRDLRVHRSLDEVSESELPDVSIPEKSQMEELVIMALARLPMAQREVIVLTVYSGYSYIEVAAMLNASVDSVRMRAMRGRTHLARIIGALMDVDEDRQTSEEFERTPTIGPPR